MADEQGISSHGTIIRVRPSITIMEGLTTLVTAGDTVEVGEVGDIQEPGTTRNEFDITSHNREIDTYVIGVQRREPVTFQVFLNKAIDSHRILRGLQYNGDPTTNMKNGFEVETPDGDLFIFSGGVREFKSTAPVDGVRTGNVTIRPTGPFILNGVTYGS